MPKYSETHHLNIDDAGLASVHVAVHLQNVNPQIAHLLVLRVLDAASAVAAVPEQGVPGQVIRPQTSGLCVHYDPNGSAPEDGDGPDYREDPPLCAYPYPYKDGCPHLDNPEILCPVKDACYAMHEVARMRDECEQEQDEQDADMADVAPSQTYETAAPEWVEPEPDDGALHTYTATRKPTNPNAWSDEEIEVIRRAQSAAEAGRLYVDAFPESNRTAAAVSSRWYRLRAAGKLIEPEPEEPVFTVPHPTYRPGARVRIKHALHRGQTGKIERYFPATENYLVAIDGLPDRIILRDKDLEVEA